MASKLELNPGRPTSVCIHKLVGLRGTIRAHVLACTRMSVRVSWVASGNKRTLKGGAVCAKAIMISHVSLKQEGRGADL